MTLKTTYSRRLPFFIFFLVGPLTINSLVASAAEQAGSLDDCRLLTDKNARFECYDKIEAKPATSATPKIPAGATQSRIPAHLPSPAETSSTTATSTLTNDKASSATVSTAPTAPAKKSFFKRILPFGLGDSNEDAAPAANTTDTSTAAPALTGNAVDNFGREAKAHVEKPQNEGAQELVDTVASVKTIMPNTLEITLKSGQIWRQMINKRFAVTAGDQIKIRPTIWGSAYRLYDDKLAGYIQVERVDK